jgi:hypothetical protein
LPCQNKSKNQGWAIGISQERPCQPGRFDAGQSRLAQEGVIDRIRPEMIPWTRAQQEAHDCDSEKDRALHAGSILQLLAHCDIGVMDLSTKHVQRAE